MVKSVVYTLTAIALCLALFVLHRVTVPVVCGDVGKGQGRSGCFGGNFGEDGRNRYLVDRHEEGIISEL